MEWSIYWGRHIFGIIQARNLTEMGASIALSRVRYRPFRPSQPLAQPWNLFALVHIWLKPVAMKI
jgi:hypothetical protein